MNQPIAEKQKKHLGWWKDAKFGLFIHWGLYATLARGEWVMAAERIPVKEYEKLAEDFNPVKFNAKDWVKMAKDAGMKYIVITAKHHDGFAMFKSEVEKFNIVDATPFKRDPMKELAEACKKQGIKLCFYYSHVIDWHHPDSVHDAANNTWDYNLEEKAYYNYWNNLAKPQIKELLTNYGDIGLLWFDTAGGLSRKDSREVVDLVKEIQPNCLINSRVSHWPNFGDYQSKGDNEIPLHGKTKEAWETPMTLNNSWGYSERDQKWKSPSAVIKKFVNILSKGGNLLLNVGPSAEGEIPEESVKRLKQIGQWIKRNKRAIYETNPSPFRYEFAWGAMTMKENELYLFIDHETWPKEPLEIYGIKNKVLRGYSLVDPEEKSLPIQQIYNEEADNHSLTIELPKEPIDDYISVIVLQLDGEIEVEKKLSQQASGVVNLDIVHANLSEKDEDGMQTATWNFKIARPGTFSLTLINFKRVDADWEEEYKTPIEIESEGQRIKALAQIDDIIEDSPACQHPYEEVYSTLGEITFSKPGVYTLSLTSDQIPEEAFGTEIWQADAVKLRTLKLMQTDE